MAPGAKSTGRRHVDTDIAQPPRIFSARNVDLKGCWSPDLKRGARRRASLLRLADVLAG